MKLFNEIKRKWFNFFNTGEVATVLINKMSQQDSLKFLLKFYIICNK